MDVHAGLLVQPQCASQVFRIHTQADLALAAPVKFAKAVLKERQPNPTLAPGTADSQNIYPAQVRVIVGFGAAEGDTCNLVAIHGKEPQVWVGAFPKQEMLEARKAFLKGFFNVPKMVTKLFLVGLIYGL